MLLPQASDKTITLPYERSERGREAESGYGGNVTRVTSSYKQNNSRQKYWDKLGRWKGKKEGLQTIDGKWDKEGGKDRVMG